MTFTEEVADDWSDALARLYANGWQDDLKRLRSPLAFRGLSNASHDLKTSLMRLGGPYVELERHLLRNFRKYARRSDSDESQSDWKWLTIGQHHGLPTRLLDWTYSPFAALHFCTSSAAKSDCDGVIWCVDFTRAHASLPKPLKNEQAKSGSNVFTVGMLERAARELPKFDALSRKPFAVFFEPPSLDDRIVNQYALFSDPSLSFDGWLERNPGLCRRVIIPARIKWEIRDKLDQANMTERVFYPGLDGLATWLTRHYSPRDQKATTSTRKPRAARGRRPRRRPSP
jgi:FRG domain